MQPPQSDRPGRARLGSHLPIAGGLARAVEHALDLDVTALQIFTASPRRWDARALDPHEARRFRRDVAKLGLAPWTLAHASYLINVASAEPAVWGHSVEALSRELGSCERLGIPWLVLHPGAHRGAGEAAALERVASALSRVLGRRSKGPGILLENTAGQGTNLGGRFEHLGSVLDAVGTTRLGVCFDTCHAWAAGYELGDRAGYQRTFEAFDRSVGLARLRAFHLNDSRCPQGSCKDRHEHIGRGYLGLEPFRRILRDPRFEALPMVLETEKGPDLAEDRMNLATLRSMLPRSRR